MSVKTILIGHPSAALRERLTSAVADARHASIPAASAAEVRAALDDGAAVDLAVIDLALADDGPAFLRDLAGRGSLISPIVVFAGSVRSAAQVAELAAAGVVGYVNEHARPEQMMQALAPHLFPHSFNRRAGTRVEVEVAVDVRADQSVSRLATRDVSRGGMAIQTMSPLPAGTAIRLTFRLPGSTAEIEAEGCVVWSDRRAGMGIQFERLTAEAQQDLTAFAGDV
jgi:uncharacterized protein (TIGR02266 family)